mmetsp:Transcript_19522/g.54302  ORF Transcript_19522/g.54302 Transcript_19522/m.54302 type:complete len:228 (-) Transcript_19522:73-756(-)
MMPSSTRSSKPSASQWQNLLPGVFLLSLSTRGCKPASTSSACTCSTASWTRTDSAAQVACLSSKLLLAQLLQPLVLCLEGGMDTITRGLSAATQRLSAGKQHLPSRLRQQRYSWSFTGWWCLSPMKDMERPLSLFWADEDPMPSSSLSPDVVPHSAAASAFTAKSLQPGSSSISAAAEAFPVAEPPEGSMAVGTPILQNITAWPTNTADVARWSGRCDLRIWHQPEE